jgi:hypothetical protein
MEGKKTRELTAIVANGFDRATFLGFLAASFLLIVLGLLVNEGISAVIVPFKIIGSRLPAKITVNALVIHVILARRVFRISISSVSHNKFVLSYEEI